MLIKYNDSGIPPEIPPGIPHHKWNSTPSVEFHSTSGIPPLKWKPTSLGAEESHIGLLNSTYSVPTWNNGIPLGAKRIPFGAKERNLGQ